MYSINNPLPTAYWSFIQSSSGDFYICETAYTTNTGAVAKQLLQIAKLNQNLVTVFAYGQNGVFTDQTPVVIQVVGQNIYADSNDNCYYISQSNYFSQLTLNKISADGLTSSKLNGFNILNSLNQYTANWDMYFPTNTSVTLVGDYWSYETIAGVLNIKHWIGIDNGNSLLKIDVDSYISSINLGSNKYLISSRSSVFSVNSDGTTNFFKNTPAWISKATNQNVDHVFIVGSTSENAKNFTISEFDLNGGIIKTFGGSGSLTVNSDISGVNAIFATADGGAILIYTDRTFTINSVTNSVAVNYNTQIEKFDKTGRIVTQNTLNIDTTALKDSNYKFSSVTDSIYVSTLDRNYTYVGITPTWQSSYQTSIYKINSDGSLDSNFNNPSASQNSLRYISAGIGLAMDLNGNAGVVAKILGAVFGVQYIRNSNYVGIGLNLLDKGMDYATLGKLAITVVDGANASNDQIVEGLWKNIMGTSPSNSDKLPFVNLLNNGMDVGQLVQIASDSSYNTNHINLVGLSITGLQYIPVI